MAPAQWNRGKLMKFFGVMILLLLAGGLAFSPASAPQEQTLKWPQFRKHLIDAGAIEP